APPEQWPEVRPETELPRKRREPRRPRDVIRPSTRIACPSAETLDMRGRDPDRRVGGDQQRRAGPRAGPVGAGLVVGVVAPCQRAARAAVALDSGKLPVSLGDAVRVVEGQV